MDPISNLISSRANALFKTPTTVEDLIINLEAKPDSQISYVPADDILFQEEVPLSLPIAPKVQITPSTEKIDKFKIMIHSMRDQLDTMLRLINGDENAFPGNTNNRVETMATGEVITEGVFDGEKMIDSNGKEYTVPPNYASKSKLVEGDKMKLTITENGRFIYKQITQIERKRLVGELELNSASGQWSITTDEKKYKVLTASVTFYKGISGDEAVFFVPKNNNCAWGAVEHIIHKK